jgi:hypothetical protein
MAGVVIGTFLLAEANASEFGEPGQPVRHEYPSWTRVLNPLLAWGRLTFRYDWFGGGYVWGSGVESWPIRFGDLAPALVCPLLYAAAGGLLWLAAVRRFEKEGRS